MGMTGGISEFLNKSFEKIRLLNGKIIGEENEIIKTKLAKTDREAWVNHLVEQHLKQEPLDNPPPEFKITKKDMIKEIYKREINKIFGK